MLQMIATFRGLHIHHIQTLPICGRLFEELEGQKVGC